VLGVSLKFFTDRGLSFLGVEDNDYCEGNLNNSRVAIPEDQNPPCRTSSKGGKSSFFISNANKLPFLQNFKT
jgi:hypothetical protein